MEYRYSLRMKVRDYECDLQGIVNNANYQHYTEHTRHEFILEQGISFADLHQRGIDAVVARITMSFKTRVPLMSQCHKRGASLCLPSGYLPSARPPAVTACHGGYRLCCQRQIGHGGTRIGRIVMTDKELLYTMALTRLQAFTPANQRTLLDEVGSATAVYENRRDLGHMMQHFSPRAADILADMDAQLPRCEEELRYARDHRIRILAILRAIGAFVLCDIEVFLILLL